MARAYNHVEVAIAVEVRSENACGLVPGHIVVFAGDVARSIPQKNGHRASVRIANGEIELAILVKVAGSQGSGGDGQRENCGGVERTIAIAEQHGEILAATGHQVHSSVAVEVPDCDGGSLRRRRVVHGGGEGTIPAPQ